MSHSSSIIINPPSARTFIRSVSGSDTQLRVSSDPSIQILDDDSLLNIFHLYRPDIPFNVDIDVRDDDPSPPKCEEWSGESWWYKFTHVCQRWRRLIFTSASYLELCLVCTPGTPVATMLTCFPTLPVVLDYPRETLRWATKDGDGILLALQYRARVRRIRLFVPPSRIDELFEAMEMEFPILEYLYIEISDREWRPDFEIHHTFQAPRLRHLVMTRCPLLVTSPSLTTCAGLVTLSLMFLPFQCRHHPYDLYQRLSLLSQLVILRTGIAHFPTDEREGQQLDILFITPLTLPNLRLFEFIGHSIYLETLLPWVTTPLLEKLQITFLTYRISLSPSHPLPCLLKFIRKADVLDFGSVKFLFAERVATAWVYPQERARAFVFCLRITTSPLGLQASEMANIFEKLRPAFSTVADLTINYSGHSRLHLAEPIQWHNLFRSLNHVKTLRVHGHFPENLSRSLLSDGEPLPEVLPNLQVLECPVGCDASDAFAAFVNARKAAGYPIRLVPVDSPARSSANTGL